MMTLQREILEVLKDLKNHPTPTRAVHSHVRLATGTEKSLDEVRAALDELRTDGYVAGVHDVDFGWRWQITAKGELRII